MVIVKRTHYRLVSASLSIVLASALGFSSAVISASAVPVDLEDDTEREIAVEGTIHDTRWNYDIDTKTLRFALESESPNWATSSQPLIDDSIISETEHVVVDSNCSNDSNNGLSDAWLLGGSFTETAENLRDVTVNTIDGEPENFRAHDGVLFLCHDSLVDEGGDTLEEYTEASLLVYPQQKKDKTFTLRKDETLKCDEFTDGYYSVDEYSLYHVLNFNKYLESIEVEEGNTFGYYSVDGVVYQNGAPVGISGNVLVFCPKTKSGQAPIAPNTQIIGDYAFFDCVNITGAAIQPEIFKIGFRSFENCTSLTELSISDYSDPDYPEGIRAIDQWMFRNCSSLKKVQIGTGNDVDGFSGCTSLETVELSDGIRRIDNNAFLGCSALKSIELPQTLEYVGVNAFMDCTALSSITIPSEVLTLNERAFFGCDSLEEVNIESRFLGCPEWYAKNVEFMNDYTDSIQALSRGVFSNCQSLKHITVNENNPALYVKDGVLYQKMIFEDKAKVIENIETPELLHIIGYEAGDERETLDLSEEKELFYLADYALYGAKNLKKVILPDTLVYIGRDVLSESGLISVTLPDSVKSVLDNSFSDCHELTEAVLSPYCSFDLPVFVNDDKLKSYTFTTPFSAEDYSGPFHSVGAIPDIGGHTVTYPDGSIENSVYEGITIRANRFIKKAYGYTDDFYEMTDFYGWKFEDLATGEVFDHSASKLRSMWSADEATGVVISITTQENDSDGYSFDLKADSADDMNSLSGDSIFLVKDGDNETYYSVDIDSSVYTEKARYNGSDDREIRIPAASENTKVYLVGSDGTTSDMNAKYYDGYAIFVQKLGVTPTIDSDAPDTDTEATDTEGSDTEPEKPDIIDSDTDSSESDTDTQPKTPDQPEPEKSYGDLDGDGYITTADALTILRSSVGLESFDDEAVAISDIDDDGIVTSTDALAVLRYSVGLKDGSKVGTHILR